MNIRIYLVSIMALTFCFSLNLLRADEISDLNKEIDAPTYKLIEKGKDLPD